MPAVVAGEKPRIGILVVAYNAAGTLARVLDRIPTDFRDRISGILVSDDHSADSTYLVGLGYQQTEPTLPLEVVRNHRNLGYGGNQKVGYNWAIEQGLDIIVMLHGDGQYAPENLPDMVAPLERGEADAVFGSRMLEEGAARRGGMPLYKYLGNKLLTGIENRLAGAKLSEWHSGYRAYSVDALRELPFERNDDDFNFDTQIILQLVEADKRIAEIPIPTFYGDEICYVNGLKYARLITRDALRYRAHKMGFGTGETAFASDSYEVKGSSASSHGRLVSWLSDQPPGRVLDLGCGDGSVAAALRARGHHVTGVDASASDEVKERVDTFIQADLDDGLPPEVAGRSEPDPNRRPNRAGASADSGLFDAILAADVLEHVRQPEQLLEELHGALGPGGALWVSVPNFAHWYPRLRVAVGRFDYDRRGILDHTHLRFFTRSSFERLVRAHGWEVGQRAYTGLPLEVADRGAPGDGASADDSVDALSDTGDSGSRGVLRSVDAAAVRLWPSLFAYQLLYRLDPVN